MPKLHFFKSWGLDFAACALMEKMGGRTLKNNDELQTILFKINWCFSTASDVHTCVGAAKVNFHWQYRNIYGTWQAMQMLI